MEDKSNNTTTTETTGNQETRNNTIIINDVFLIKHLYNKTLDLGKNYIDLEQEFTNKKISKSIYLNKATKIKKEISTIVKSFTKFVKTSINVTVNDIDINTYYQHALKLKSRLIKNIWCCKNNTIDNPIISDKLLYDKIEILYDIYWAIKNEFLNNKITEDILLIKLSEILENVNIIIKSFKKLIKTNKDITIDDACMYTYFQNTLNFKNLLSVDICYLNQKNAKEKK